MNQKAGFHGFSLGLQFYTRREYRCRNTVDRLFMNSEQQSSGQEGSQSLREVICRERELRWLQHFRKIEERSNIRWLHRDIFFSICDERAAARLPDEAPLASRYWAYPATFEEMRARVAEPPLFFPPDDDFPGPVERWYGSVGELLFTFDYHYALSAFYCESIDNDDVVNVIKSALDEFFALKPF